MGKTPALLAAVLAVALLRCDRSQRPATAVLLPVRVAYTVQPQSTLVHVALAKGYFTEEGLKILPSVHTFGKAALQAVLDHQADFATAAETPIMFQVLKGEPITVVANIEASTTNNAIVARRDAGIKGPADLKAKRIGFTPGTTSEFFLDSMLTTQGLTRAQIHPLPLKPEAMQAAILGGQVDAVSTWNYPLTQIHHQLAGNGVLLLDRDIFTETFNIALQTHYLQEHPDTVRRFLRALLKAEAFVARDPAGAQIIMATATGTDLSLVREVWAAFHYQVCLNQTLLLTLEDEARWAMKNQLTDQKVMPDFRRHIHPETLRSLKPDAVRSGH